MWVLDWFRNKRKKKAFRVIRITKGCQTKHSLRLVIPTHQKILHVQKTIVERVVEKQQKQLQKLQPIHVQVIQLRVMPASIHHIRSANVWNPKKQKRQKQELRQEIMRLQRIGFQEEQAYFRTRPTLAKQMFHDLLGNRKPSYYRASKKSTPIHLEILKQAVLQEPSKEMEAVSMIQEATPSSTPLPKEWSHQLIKEVIRQLQKEAWRTGGIASWRK